MNALGRLDAVIHNAGVGERGTNRPTADGVPVVFAVNVLAPYVLTALIERPDRLVYLSSSMHSGARLGHLADHWRDRRWVGPTSYSQSKFLVTALAFAVARLWPEVCSNAVDPEGPCCAGSTDRHEPPVRQEGPDRTFDPRRSLNRSSRRMSNAVAYSRTSRESRAGSHASARIGFRIRRRESGAMSMMASAHCPNGHGPERHAR